MTVANWNWVRTGAQSVIVAAVLAASGALQMQRMAHADPQSTIVAFIAAVNAGDSATAAGLFAASGHYSDIGPSSSFAAIGRPAIQVAFIDMEGTQMAIENVTINDTRVSGAVTVTNDSTGDAGVSRILQPFVSLVVNDEIQFYNLLYDPFDSETQAYLRYLDTQPGDEPPPGAEQMPMTGTQAGSAFAFTSHGVTSLALRVAPGSPDTRQPATAREGTCAMPGSQVSLVAPVVDGSSDTLLSLALADLDDRVLVVEASDADATQVSCGAFADLEAVPMSPPVEALPDTGDGSSTDNGAVIATLLLVLAGAFALGGVTFVAAGVRRRA